jgi:hypothetical protein
VTSRNDAMKDCRGINFVGIRLCVCYRGSSVQLLTVTLVLGHSHLIDPKFVFSVRNKYGLAHQYPGVYYRLDVIFIRRFSPLQLTFRPILGPTQPHIQWVPGIKRLGPEADHSPPCSAEVRRGGAITSTHKCLTN